MQTVLLTPTFLRQATRCRLEDDEILELATVIAGDPMAGDIISGTGGARKLRHALGNKGKSGGLRTIHYFGGSDIPVFLLAVYGKSDRANISKAERNQLADLLPRIGEAYRRKKTQ